MSLPESPSILIVEDNDFVRMQVSNFLNGTPYKIVSTSNANDALALMAADNNVGLMIVDMLMEPMGGLEFLKILRSEDVKVPAILITGDNAPDILERTSNMNIAAVLMKPIQKERLVMAVAKTFNNARR
jgi:CheY-like chemotaxis protein